MQRQEVSGALASGGSFRATPTLLEILTPTGEIAATFDTRYFESVTRDGQTVSITRIGNSSINVEAASLDDAIALGDILQLGANAPTPTAAATTADTASTSEGGFNSLLKWGCIGTLAIVGILSICLILALVFFRDDDDESSAAAAPTATATESVVATETVADTDETAVPDDVAPTTEPESDPTETTDDPALDATATPEPVDEPDPTATSEPEPSGPSEVGLGRDNPVPLGDVIEAENWTLQVLDVLRGDDAYDRLLETNQFNSPPPEGHEFVLVSLSARYTGDSDEVQDIDGFWFRSTGDARIRHSNVFPVNPEPVFRGSLFQNGEVTGWMTVLAREGETNLMLIFEEWLNFDADEVIYLALEDGASIDLPTGRLAEENDLGFNVNSPVPFGESAVGENWEIWIVDHVRGDEALDRVMEANMFNDEPEEGMEYVLVHVGARNVGTSAEPEQISSFLFRITGDAGRVYDNPWVVDPEPALDFEMYPGGEATGWITMMVPEGEQNLRLVYEPWFSFTAQPRYFSLE
jgi:hypothetical protein